MSTSNDSPAVESPAVPSVTAESGPAEPRGPAGRPWHSDPAFLAGVAVSVILLVVFAARPFGCRSCKERERMAAELGGEVDLPAPTVRAAARPPQQPGPGVAAQQPAPPPPAAPAPVVEQQAPAAAPAPARNAFTGTGARCDVVEWCGLPLGHEGPHLAPARAPLTAAELAEAAAEATSSS
jgi:hypothetical protein